MARAVAMIIAIAAQIAAGRISGPLLLLLLTAHLRQPYIHDVIAPLVTLVAVVGIVVEAGYIKGSHVWANVACASLTAWTLCYDA